MTKPISKVFLLAKRTFKAMDGFQRKILAELDLTSAQYSILSHLWEEDKIPFKELAARCCCTRPTVTGIVDTLEKKGLVKRTKNSNDRRSLLAELTSEGRKLELKAPKLDDMFSKYGSSMNSDDIAKLEDLLTRFLQELEFSE